jgi:glycosyltransferase involved in cell wall biosynthesis
MKVAYYSPLPPSRSGIADYSALLLPALRERVDVEELADLYARSLAVYYAPIDEDFGMVPYEAFLSGKPVVTTHDAGGPLEVVHDRETGVVVAPDPTAIAQACVYLASNVDEAKAWGNAGRALAERVTWDACVDALLS